MFNADTCPHSILVQKVTMQGIAEGVYLTAAEKYAESPKMLLFKTITEEDQQRQNFLQDFKAKRHSILCDASCILQR